MTPGGAVHQGVSLDGVDCGHALDLSSSGGRFVSAVAEGDKARAAASTLSDFRVSGLSVGLSSDLNSFNQTFESPRAFDGYKPYVPSPGYDTPPELIWAEGTWGPCRCGFAWGRHFDRSRLDAAAPGRWTREAGSYRPPQAVAARPTSSTSGPRSLERLGRRS